jgi:hypothetical protein
MVVVGAKKKVMVCLIVKAREIRNKGEGYPTKVECEGLFWGEAESSRGVGSWGDRIVVKKGSIKTMLRVN